MMQNPRRMRSFFVQVLVFGRPQAPLDLWEEFSDTMYDHRGTSDNEALRSRRGFSNAQCGLPMPMDERGQPMAPATTRQMVDMFYFPGRRFENEDEVDGSAEPQKTF
uniref:Uncharacterized protein n=1 Tax=Ditylenchus dipsaci TaxID=166011 RepID=A0A915DAI6_9BILA